MLKGRKISCFIIPVLSLLLLTGCPGAQDFSLELPGDYSVESLSAHQVIISSETSRQISDTHWSSIIIPAKVVMLGWDDNYILVKQLGLKKDPNSNNGYKIPDEDNANFWIVAIHSEEVYGPFDEGAFEEKRNELGVLESVKLKYVNEYR